LSELRAQFDYVIIDSSPLLAVTDAAVLSANSDGVLIMARFGETKREQLAHAVGSLEDVGAHLLGAVFTMVPARGNTSYSYYGGYGSYGSYGTQHSTPQESRTEPTEANSSVSEPDIVAQSAGSRHRHEEPE
jgi:receptor protein-tyrosine kinase